MPDTATEVDSGWYRGRTVMIVRVYKKTEITQIHVYELLTKILS